MGKSRADKQGVMTSHVTHTTRHKTHVHTTINAKCGSGLSLSLSLSMFLNEPTV